MATINDYSLSAAATDKTAIDSYLASIDPLPSINAIMAGARAEATPAARETYLRAAHTADTGDPTAVNGRPRFEALVALEAMREAKLESETPLSGDATTARMRIVNTVGAAFFTRSHLDYFFMKLVAAGGPETNEVRRIATRLVGDLDDAASVLTVGDYKEWIGFAPSTAYDNFLANAYGQKVVGITA